MGYEVGVVVIRLFLECLPTQLESGCKLTRDQFWRRWTSRGVSRRSRADEESGNYPGRCSY